MDEKFIPKINCRFKIRKDINGFLGFFQGKGVLTFNEVGAFIVKQMTGEKKLMEIGRLVGETFPLVKNPENEVLSIVKQFQKAGFF
ncbi:PqqD family protein [Candidatus Wolfebacteria bacterium]|nr:PqqD family protein [Candidatus Wolfebacteria bacterium]